MGLFSSHGEKASKFSRKSEEPGLSPERRRQLLMKAIEESDRGEDACNMAGYVRSLLVTPGVARDIAALRAQLEKSKTARNAQMQGATFFSDLQELEKFGLNDVGISEEEIRTFLIEAAQQGCSVAADYGESQFGWEGFWESYRLAALRGRFRYAGTELWGKRCSMAGALRYELNADNYRKGRKRIGGIVGGEEFKFWDRFDHNLLHNPDQIPPYEEALAQLNAAREADMRGVRARNEADKLYPKIRNVLRARLTELEAELHVLIPKAAYDDGWLEPQLLETFCDWLLGIETLDMLKSNRLPPEDVVPVCPSAGTEALFREGRIEEHLGHDYQKIIKLYQQAAEQGHGEAAWRLHQLLDITSNYSNPWYEKSAKLAMAAGYPCAWDGFTEQKDRKYFSLIRLAQKGDLDALHLLVKSLCSRSKKPWLEAAKTAAQMELALNRQLDLKGDPEAGFRLFRCYGSSDFETLGLKDQDLIDLYRDRCFKRGFGLAYYEAAANYFYYFKDTPSDESRMAWAVMAEEAGIPGAVSQVSRNIKEHEAYYAAYRKRMEDFKREYYAQQRRVAEARYAEERRRAVEAGMDEYRERRDWAERAVSDALGGSGTTLDESYLRGEVGMDSYGTALFIRSQQEDALRCRLEEEYDASHRIDEE